jgi:hypothetical protein
MSSGDLTIDGTHARYELRMPLYEVAHVPHPETELLDHIGFSNGGRAARTISQSCTPDPAHDTYLCTAEYEFAAPDGQVDIECSFPAITVPNHVHLLRATRAGKNDQAIFDRSFPRATLRFRPPTPFETSVTEVGAGFIRALSSGVQILFLAALALAARSRRELITLAGVFLVGQAAAVFGVPRTGFQPAARFVEAGAALAVAYLAVEILLLPKAGARWLVAGVLGVFPGLYFHLFLQNTGYRPAVVLAGAAFAEVSALALLALIFSRIRRWAQPVRPVQVAASALLVFGMVWFFIRLRS